MDIKSHKRKNALHMDSIFYVGFPHPDFFRAFGSIVCFMVKVQTEVIMILCNKYAISRNAYGTNFVLSLPT